MILRGLVWRQLCRFAKPGRRRPNEPKRSKQEMTEEDIPEFEDDEPYIKEQPSRSVLNEGFRRQYDPKYNAQEEEEEEERAVPPGNKAYMKDYADNFDNTSILNRFRKRVFERSITSPEEEQINRSIQEYNRKLHQILNTGGKEEQLSASQKLVEKFINDKEIFSTSTNNFTGISDYADYAPYKKNRVTIKDRKVEMGGEILGKHLQRDYKFLSNLGPEYQESVSIQEEIAAQPGMTVDQMARQAEALFQTAQKWDLIEDNDVQRASEIPINEEMIIDEPEAEPDYLEEISATRLSPNVTFKIYQLYTEGWSVRELSKRFGILPNRVKFIVWSKAQLFMEVLPRLGFDHFRKCMDFEIQYGKEFGFTEYGLDLAELSDDGRFMENITTWNNKLYDIKEEDHERRERSIERLEKRTDITKGYALLDNGTHGAGSYLYFLRDWKRFRGKGSDFWHLSRNTFKSLYKNKGRRSYC